MGKSMLNKYNKNLSIIILGIALVVYILFMAVTGRVFDVGKSTIAANTNEDTEYTVGRISNDREYSIVVDKKVSNLKSISLKIKDLREKYTQENIECHDLKISADSLKIVVKGKNIPQDSELVIYGNRQDKIENLASYDDDMQISGNILCIVVEGRKKISTDFLWGLVLIAFIGITVNFLKMKANANGGSNGKKNNK